MSLSDIHFLNLTALKTQKLHSHTDKLSFKISHGAYPHFPPRAPVAHVWSVSSLDRTHAPTPYKEKNKTKLPTGLMHMTQ